MESAPKNSQPTVKLSAAHVVFSIVLLAPLVAYYFWGIRDVLAYVVVAVYSYAAFRVFKHFVWHRDWI